MNELQSTFLKTVVPASQAAQRLSGIPASITIAQAILESGWGQSALAKQANNYFGVKATAHLSPSQYAEFPTTEFVDGRKRSVMAAFARYATPADSFAAHTGLIAGSPRYRAAMNYCARPELFAYELQLCGYSTNPVYVQSLLGLVREFDLTQYDLPPTPAAPAAAQEEEKVA